MKDEEMAEEYLTRTVCQGCRNICEGDCAYAKPVRQAFLAGLKAGRPQWHKVADGDLPEVDNRIVLCVCENGYIDGKRNYKLKLLTRKEFSLFQPVIKWCEIPTFDKE